MVEGEVSKPEHPVIRGRLPWQTKEGVPPLGTEITQRDSGKAFRVVAVNETRHGKRIILQNPDGTRITKDLAALRETLLSEDNGAWSIGPTDSTGK